MAAPGGVIDGGYLATTAGPGIWALTANGRPSAQPCGTARHSPPPRNVSPKDNSLSAGREPQGQVDTAWSIRLPSIPGSITPRFGIIRQTRKLIRNPTQMYRRPGSGQEARAQRRSRIVQRGMDRPFRKHRR